MRRSCTLNPVIHLCTTSCYGMWGTGPGGLAESCQDLYAMALCGQPRRPTAIHLREFSPSQSTPAKRVCTHAPLGSYDMGAPVACDAARPRPCHAALHPPTPLLLLVGTHVTHPWTHVRASSLTGGARTLGVLRRGTGSSAPRALRGPGGLGTGGGFAGPLGRPRGLRGSAGGKEGDACRGR